MSNGSLGPAKQPVLPLEKSCSSKVWLTALSVAATRPRRTENARAKMIFMVKEWIDLTLGVDNVTGDNSWESNVLVDSIAEIGLDLNKERAIEMRFQTGDTLSFVRKVRTRILYVNLMLHGHCSSQIIQYAKLMAA